MQMTVNFTMRFDKPTRKLLDRLAKRERRKPGDYLRLLVVRDAERLGLLPANHQSVVGNPTPQKAEANAK